MVKHQQQRNPGILTLIFAAALPLAIGAKAAGWDYQWQQAEAVTQMPLLPVTAEVVQNVQATQTLVLPFEVQVHTVYVQSGQQVQAGEPLLKLSGPQVLNFAERLDIAEHHAKAAALRLRDNQARYAAGDILRETWLEWQHQAHQTALELDALRQQQQLLAQWQAKTGSDGLTLLASSAGTVLFGAELPAGAQLPAGSRLLSMQQSQQTVLELRLPAAQQANSVQTPNCTLALTWRSGVVDQQFRRFRSSALTPDCALLPGQRLSVQPWQAQEGYKLPRQAIVQDGAGDAVITGPDTPALLPVRVLGRSGNWVYLQADLAGKPVATADVAALKGQLQGMGGTE
ncbi:MAG: hypothetical protein E6Q75_01285 [Rheinheimera sp.]|nr:MAG: hypothetical protein E6Q75_01285 [Rheinheimera sp.]